MSQRTTPKRRIVTRGVSMPVELERQLLAQAAREDRSISGMLRVALRDYLARHGALAAVMEEGGGGELASPSPAQAARVGPPVSSHLPRRDRHASARSASARDDRSCCHCERLVPSWAWQSPVESRGHCATQPVPGRSQ